MILKGIKGLLESKKATLCLLILTISSVALFFKCLDSTSFAAIVATISTIYQYTVHKTEIASMGVNNDKGI